MTTTVQLQTAVPPVPVKAEDSAQAEEQLYRAGMYELLAATLRRAPDQRLLERISTLAADARDDLGLAISALGLAARQSDAARVDDEYHDLFIGLGRGELMPYASWYLTGFLMEQPLGNLRSDLRRLGIERTPDTHEPEDHVAAMCEVMTMLIRDGHEFERQAAFFEAHIAPWCDRFFADLSNARAGVFYRNLGRLGAAFYALEQRYFSMRV